MPDIFLSYNREDQATARRFAEAFTAEGMEVWWDTTLRAGEAYDEVTEDALKTAKAVVVLWSPRSVVSRWVRAEATQADRNKTLVPVTIEPCTRPIMFELTQTADLSTWDGSSTDKAWQSFMADVRRFLQVGGTVPAPAPSAAPPAGAVARPPGRLSICVLPFANMSRDDEQEYFADGISEDIITDLSKVSALSVISRNSAFTFKGKHVDLPQVARQLQVTHVLEGSVRKAGDRIRITAQLIDGSTNDHVWAERYDRDLSDIFALQDEISQEIVEALKLTLFPEEKKAIEDRGASNVEAYDLYLRARALHRQQGATELRRSIEIFHEALALDPQFVPAWRGLYHAHLDGLVYDAETIQEAVGGMAQAAEQVLALTPDAWWSHVLRSHQFMQQHQWAKAETAAHTAMSLAPPSELEPANAYGVALASVGRAREAVKYLEDVRRIDPLSLLASSVLQAVLTNAEQPDAADTEFERSKDLSGDREIAEHYALFRAVLRGDEAAARDLARRVKDHEVLSVVGLGDVAALFDDPRGMLERARRIQADPANQDSTRQYKLAAWASWLGDAELGAAALRCFAVDLPGARYGALWAPILGPVRRSVAFKQMVRELGFHDYWRSTGNWGDFARPVGDDDFEIIR
jgi:adenylate cyclase